MRRAALSAIDFVLVRALCALLFWSVVLANLSSCVAVGTGLKWMGDRLIQIGGGAVVGFLAWLFTGVGWAAVLVGTFTASVWTALMVPTATGKNGQPAGPDRLTWIVVGAVGALVVRAWAHYPDMFRKAWLLVKSTARGFLGGVARKVEAELPQLPPEAREIAP